MSFILQKQKKCSYAFQGTFISIQGIQTDGCGKTIGCLRYQSDCSGSSCDFVVTYSYQPTTNLVTFDMFGKSAEWVAIGFSDDKKMVRAIAVTGIIFLLKYKNKKILTLKCDLLRLREVIQGQNYKRKKLYINLSFITSLSPRNKAVVSMWPLSPRFAAGGNSVVLARQRL